MIIPMNETFFRYAVDSFVDHLYRWQTLVGAFIAVLAPIILWLFSEYFKERKNRKQYLYYLQRMIVDQINLLIDTRGTINDFVGQKVDNLLSRIDQNPESAYSANTAFFPMFSVRPMPDDINKISSGSGYIDNKVAKVYALSRDFPHIIDDIRMQLKDTIDRNEKIAFGRFNSPEIQKEQFKENLIEYKRMVTKELLEINIPLYLTKLAEVLVAVREKFNRSSIMWKIKFDPRWKLYDDKETYLRARERIIENMDAYFKTATERQLKDIEERLARV